MNTASSPPLQPELPDRVTGSEPVLHLVPEHGAGFLLHAWEDLFEGLKLARLGFVLGWLDIRLRYRGSLLGPLWLTIATAIMVSSMGVLYSYLMHMNVRVYLPFLTFSLVVWGFMAGLLQDGCATFTSSAALIHSARIPYTLYVIRATVRNWLVFLHNAPVVIVVFFWFHAVPAWSFSLLAGVFLWLFDSFMATLFLAVLGARFRDTPPIVVSLINVMFFITPILWMPGLMTTGASWLLLDPFFPLLEVVRAPLTGDLLQVMVWPAALLWSGLLGVAACLLFVRMRFRLAYWI